MKLRFSKKLLLVISGIFVLTGASGAAAVYIGADKLLGPSYADKNGLACTEVTTVTIKKKDRLWIRKYIKTDEPGDGLARVRTALRVAKAVYEKDEHKKPDLVQVVVLDKNGPTERSAMRGRAIGADVILVPNPASLPDAGQDKPFVARYVDKPAAATGEFYGDKIFMADDDIKFLLSKLDDKTDCVSLTPPAAAKDGHGAPAAESKGGDHATPKAESGGHGEAEKPAAEAEAKTEGEPKAEGHGTAADGETPAESKGWFASVKGMILGGDEPAEDTANAEDHGTGKGVKVDEAAATPADEKGWIDSVKGMIFGGEESAPAEETTSKPESAKPQEHAAAAPEKPAPEKTAARGSDVSKVASHDPPAEDSDWLPPKASDKAKQADASH